MSASALASNLARNGRAPGGEVGRDFELDRRELDAAHLGDFLRELSRPAAGLAAEDRLQRLALLRVGARVDEDAHRRLGIDPDVALEAADRDHVEPVERDVAEAPVTDVPGEDPLADARRGRLREFAGAGDVAFANVEPVAVRVPTRSVHLPSGVEGAARFP